MHGDMNVKKNTESSFDTVIHFFSQLQEGNFFTYCKIGFYCRFVTMNCLV